MLQSNAVTECDYHDANISESPRPTVVISIVPPAAQEPEHSFDDLCVPLHDEMLNYAKKLTANDEARAEDIVQDAFVKAFRSWPRWAPPENTDDAPMFARAWLFRVVQHVFISDYNRHASRGRHFKGRDLDIAELAHAGAQPSPLEETTADTFCDAVAEALASLTPERRAAIEAVYVRGLGCKEYATESGIPINTVGVQLLRARRDLARKLDPVASSLGLKQCNAASVFRRRRVS